MARFFGCNLDKKKQLNRPVLSWLTRLSNDFTVFVELEGSDFSVDFLVIKKFGIFNVEAKHWRVKEAHSDADWVMESGEKFPNPFLEQVLDQCEKIADYLIVQRDSVFGKPLADAVMNNRNQLRIFPVVALSYPGIAPTISLHSWRRTFADDGKLRQHLNRFQWFPESPTKPIAMESETIARLASLFHLEEVSPITLRPFHTPTAPPPAAPKPAISLAQPAEPTNPYQYTYVVTGGDFYGREQELTRIRRALEHSTPVAIVGLQRTGKSSLALESIRRLTHANSAYTVIKYDFRRLRSEGPNPEEDLTLEFIRGMATEGSADEVEKQIESYRDTAAKGTLSDQRKLFREALLKNRERNRRVVLFLDECQEISEFLSETRYQSFIAYLDSLCRERELGLNVILACRPSFFEMTTIKNINLGRMFEMITLGALEEEAATDIIRRGANNMKFDISAERRLQFLTGRHPFWLQFMCHMLFENGVLKGDFSTDVAKVNNMFERILKDPGFKPQFYLLYQEVESDHFTFALLKTIASVADSETGMVELHTVAPEWKTNPQVNCALRLLVDNQIIHTENEINRPGLRFQVDALRQWMRVHLATI